MSIKCQLRSPDLDDDDLHRLTRDFARTLAEETDVAVHLETSPAASGTRGDPVTLGAILLTFLSGGAAVGLTKVLEIYAGRRKSLEVELARPDGSKLSIKAQDLAPHLLSQTQAIIEKFVRTE